MAHTHGGAEGSATTVLHVGNLHYATEKNVVEPFDPCLDEVRTRHQVPPALTPGSGSPYPPARAMVAV